MLYLCLITFEIKGRPPIYVPIPGRFELFGHFMTLSLFSTTFLCASQVTAHSVSLTIVPNSKDLMNGLNFVTVRDLPKHSFVLCNP